MLVLAMHPCFLTKVEWHFLTPAGCVSFLLCLFSKLICHCGFCLSLDAGVPVQFADFPAVDTRVNDGDFLTSSVALSERLPCARIPNLKSPVAVLRSPLSNSYSFNHREASNH